MRRWALGTIPLVAAALLVDPLAAKALVVRIPSLPEKVVQSDAIVVGKVQALEDKPVEARAYPGVDQKIPYTIATIRIDESLAGVKNLTHVRVGFIPQPKEQPNTGARPPIRPRGGMVNPTLQTGQEGCFFLQKHFEGDFYVITPMCSPIEKKDEAYQKQLDSVQKAVKLLASPVESLQSKNLDERVLTASLLLQKYRQFRNTTGGQPVQKPIDAAESRLVLQTIAEADWTKNDPEMMALSGQMLFNMLGLQAKDGWTPPRVQRGQNYQEELQKAAKKWLKDHAATHRIQMWAAAEKK